ncbi:hypothetical protein Moror_11825 [Moniliophthora roreri MCA 2997]|uniref:Uncharacterized protein n=1 Tax=Moniliophthora roreri (strain MCA 2997) TaxID=1381753 RepID=V2WMZ4_MONRO|nr:hypothetical protein Moror_11825 [Moniliophthora roreri MCA 2997]
MTLLAGLSRSIIPNSAASADSSGFDSTTGECVDIRKCRTVIGIIWSCLSVVFICTWVSIHPNVPRVGTHAAVVIYQNIVIMVIALLAPELVVLWAMRQWFSAKEIAKKYKDYGWSTSHAFLILMGGFALYDGESFSAYLWEGNANAEEPRQGWQDGPPVSESTSRRSMIEAHHRKVQGALECPDSPNDSQLCLLKYLLVNGYITINKDEIDDNLSHGDFVSKSIAVVQTTWFLLQVLARAAEGLAITELEIITVGFALLNLAIYYLWRKKPLRVRYPVRVDWQRRRLDVESKRSKRKNSVKKTIHQGAIFITLDIIIGFYTMLLERERFWRWEIPQTHAILFTSRLKKDPLRLYIAVYSIAFVFGAIHCIPWVFHFPTHSEQLLWRTSAVAVAAAPIALGLQHLYGGVIFTKYKTPVSLDRAMLGIALLLFAFYTAARIILIVVAFTALRDLPPSAYQTVQWTTFIPYID